MKNLYEYQCQICGQTLVVPGKGPYAEVHHVRPLGGDHRGPDRMSNMMCLCPLHHAEMDLGVLYVDPRNLVVVHSDPRNKYNKHPVHFNEHHKLDESMLKYHRDRICGGWS